MRDSRPRLVSLRYGAPLVIVAGAFLAPSPAHGGCDYPAHIEYAAVPSSLPGHAPAMPNAHPRLPGKPCSCTGPTCSRRPFVPPTPSSLQWTTASEWARLLPQLVIVPPAGEMCLPEEPDLQPQRLATSIYHPPRLS